jgi:hypothetical protein
MFVSCDNQKVHIVSDIEKLYIAAMGFPYGKIIYKDDKWIPQYKTLEEKYKDFVICMGK